MPPKKRTRAQVESDEENSTSNNKEVKSTRSKRARVEKKDGKKIYLLR